MRIDRGKILKEMADALGYTSSYLSGIECGKHSVPVGMVSRLSELYQFTDEELRRLKAAYDATLKEARLDLKDTSEEQRNVALLFARTFRNLSAEELEKMQDILSKKGKQDEL